jgi:hypothetical protein
MISKLREAWTTIIQARDYDAHMASVGQAQANARLVADYFQTQAPEAKSSILFLGAGTGQMFDFISPSILLPYQSTFTDINGSYLEQLSERLRRVEGLRYATVVDDVEETRLAPGFHAIVAVLLLEHVDWRKTVSTISGLATNRVFVIVQENPATLATAITPTREIAGTMKIFKEVHPSLIPRNELEAEFARNGFIASYSAEKIVADHKKMLAIGFGRAS